MLLLLLYKEEEEKEREECHAWLAKLWLIIKAVLRWRQQQRRGRRRRRLGKRKCYYDQHGRQVDWYSEKKTQAEAQQSRAECAPAACDRFNHLRMRGAYFRPTISWLKQEKEGAKVPSNPTRWRANFSFRELRDHFRSHRNNNKRVTSTICFESPKLSTTPSQLIVKQQQSKKKEKEKERTAVAFLIVGPDRKG